jgi:hypothetical protein
MSTSTAFYRGEYFVCCISYMLFTCIRITTVSLPLPIFYLVYRSVPFVLYTLYTLYTTTHRATLPLCLILLFRIYIYFFKRRRGIERSRRRNDNRGALFVLCTMLERWEKMGGGSNGVVIRIYINILYNIHHTPAHLWYTTNQSVPCG